MKPGRIRKEFDLDRDTVYRTIGAALRHWMMDGRRTSDMSLNYNRRSLGLLPGELPELGENTVLIVHIEQKEL